MDDKDIQIHNLTELLNTALTLLDVYNVFDNDTDTCIPTKNLRDYWKTVGVYTIYGSNFDVIKSYIKKKNKNTSNKKLKCVLHKPQIKGS